MNNLWFMVLACHLHFLFLVAFDGFGLPIWRIPCNLEGFCISNLVCSNCFSKIIVFFNSWKGTMWDEPHTPHVAMSMYYNNLSKANCTNKGCSTFYNHCASTWNWSHSLSIFFFAQLIAFISLHVCLSWGVA